MALGVKLPTSGSIGVGSRGGSSSRSSGGSSGGFAGSLDTVARRANNNSLTGSLSPVGPAGVSIRLGSAGSGINFGTMSIPNISNTHNEFVQNSQTNAINRLQQAQQSGIASNPEYHRLQTELGRLPEQIQSTQEWYGVGGTPGIMQQRLREDHELQLEYMDLQQAAIRAQSGSLADRQAYLSQLEAFSRRAYGLTNQHLDLQEENIGISRDRNLESHLSDQTARGAFISHGTKKGQADIHEDWGQAMKSLGITREEALLGFEREMASIMQQRKEASREGASISNALRRLGLDRRQMETALDRATYDANITGAQKLTELEGMMTSGNGQLQSIAMTELMAAMDWLYTSHGQQIPDYITDHYNNLATQHRRSQWNPPGQSPQISSSSLNRMNRR